jgi:dTMP kinase
MSTTTCTAGARARFITFEGIDGAGKTTHIGRLAQALRDRGHEVRVTREPGGTTLAEALRELVLTRSMDALTEALLVFAARRDHLATTIEPALASGATVVCDRFTDASFAYQGGGRGCSREVLEHLESWVQQGRQPDLTLWFDLPAAEAARRRAAVREPDRFEAQDTAFFERVREGYALRRAADPRRFAVIDARLPVEEVWVCVEAAAREHGLW